MFKVEVHDNSREFFETIQIQKKTLHITSNTTIKELIKDNVSNKDEQWRIQEFEQIIEKLYYDWKNPIHRNIMMGQLRINLIQLRKENADNIDIINYIKNINLLLESYIFLMECGITYIPDSAKGRIFEENFVNVFNIFTKDQKVIKYYKEVANNNKLINIGKILSNSDENEGVQKIYLYNFSSLSLPRLMFIYNLYRVGHEIIFRIPKYNGLIEVNKVWKNIYSNDIFLWQQELYNKKNYHEFKKNNKFIAYIEGEPIDIIDNSLKISFKNYNNIYEFMKNYKECNNYFCLCREDFKKYFSINHYSQENIEHYYELPLGKFIKNLYVCKIHDRDIELSYDIFEELIISGCIEIKTGNRFINGKDYLGLLKMLEPYLENIKSINEIIERLECLSKLNNVSLEFEKLSAQKAGNNRVKKYLSNPFRVFSFVNWQSYDINIVQFRYLVEKLKIVLLKLLYNEEGYIELQRHIEILENLICSNKYLQSIKKETSEQFLKKVISLKFIIKDIKKIYIDELKEIMNFVLVIDEKAQNKGIKGNIYSINQLDGFIYRRFDGKNVSNIYLSDFSDKTYRDYINNKENIPYYINYDKMKKLFRLYSDNKIMVKLINISICSYESSQDFIKYLVANIFMNFQGSINMDYIKGFKENDSETILYNILKTLYSEKVDNSIVYFNEFDDVYIEKYENIKFINKEDYSIKHSKFPDVYFLDLDFCALKFLYSSILNSYPIYEEDFHHRIVFSIITEFF
ncbi:hypothetical protein [Haloimpatiens lingqiaonensis]|uniref:hypothetical protein n=2 Tax=Haloimpatiens lingqiaonensis TaxID=1380675 RepID=UPI0037C0E721